MRKEGLCLYKVHRVQELRRMDYVPTYLSPIIPSRRQERCGWNKCYQLRHRKE